MSRTEHWMHWLRRACVALPLAMLAANLLAWLRWGTDLPFLDDWRAYYEGQALSLAPGHLFRAVNNTVAPLGIFLDVMAQRWLGGNPLPYQALSMLAVLGGLLWLQWRLLRWAPRGPAWQVAALFVLTIFMLQSGSYWGEQNLAYHQALPLVVLLAAAWCNFGARLPGATRLLAVALLGLMAGLAYISGAVAALVMGACWMLLAWLTPQRQASALAARGRSGGAALAIAGLATTVMQVALTRRSGADPAGQAMRLVWPTDADFWLYAAGKLGRASGHGFASLGAEVIWVAALALALLGAAALAWRGLRRGRARRVAWLLLPLMAAVLVYLALVSLGRAGLHGADVQSPAQVFRFAYLRFHHFWLTLLPPWVAAAWTRCRRRGARLAKAARARPAVAIHAGLVAVVLGVAAARGVFDVAPFYQSASAFRAGEIRCLSRQLGSGRPIMCPGFELLGITDWSIAYRHAREIGASFVRYLPIVAHDGWGEALFDWNDSGQRQAVRWHNARLLEDGWMEAGPDPQMIVPLAGGGPAAGQCAVLGVQVTLELEQPGAAQLFYRVAGQAAYAQSQSVSQAALPDAQGRAWVEFVVDGSPGFEPEVRIDPIDGPGRFRLLDAHVTCRLREAAK
jgi:hypothetical protein